MEDLSPTSPARTPVVGRPGNDCSQDPFLGTLIDARYRLIKRIGRGGMGVVYRAQDLKLGGRPCAIKLLRRDVDRAVHCARFGREIELVSRLSSPQIVSVSDTGQLFDGSPFVVMELLRGKNLAQLLKVHGSLSTRSAIKIAMDVLAGLDAAHRQGVVHRDIKPGNVFISKNRYGEITTKIVDFGVATDITDPAGVMNQPRYAYGTATYMAPEQFTAQPCDGRADIYGVGLLLYRMLAGRNPFSANDPVPTQIAKQNKNRRLAWLHLNSKPRPLAVDEDLRRIIERLMAREPDDRFSSADAAIKAIQAWLEAAKSTDKTVQKVQANQVAIVDFSGENRNFPEPHRTRWRAFAGPILLAASIIALSWTFPQKREPSQHQIAVDNLCRHTISSEPVSASIYRGEVRLGTTPMIIERPCQEVWLISLRSPLMKEYPMKLRGRVHNQPRTVKMERMRIPVPDEKAGGRDKQPREQRESQDESNQQSLKNEVPVPDDRTGSRRYARVLKGI